MIRLECHISSAGYRGKRVLYDINFDAEAGQLVAIVGKNGAGKSTFLSALAGLVPYEGEVRVDGKRLQEQSPRERARMVSFMAQLARPPHVTVEQLLLFGRAPYRSFAARPSAADVQAVEWAMEQAELLALRHQPVDRMSGGEVRRAYFGLLLAQDTPLILTDEATAFMDARGEQRLFEVLGGLCRERGKTVISVTHSLEQAVLADRVAVLNEGRLAYIGSPRELTETDVIERLLGMRCYRAVDGAGKEKLFFSPLTAT